MAGKMLALVSGVVLALGLFMAGSADAAQRCVLAELFTNTA